MRNSGFKLNTGVKIKHFVPAQSRKALKIRFWYKRIEKELDNRGTTPPPSQTEHFEEWKRYNPFRESYRGY